MEVAIALDFEERPTVGRHVNEERLCTQLARSGLRMPNTLNYNDKVAVKAKWWHKLKTKGITSPFLVGKIKCPSPLMSIDVPWMVNPKRKSGYQHARTVAVPDQQADRVVLGTRKPFQTP